MESAAMGMYDSLRCHYPLPDGWDPGDRLFQTKSLDSCLDLYTLTADGRLLVDRTTVEPVPPAERKYPPGHRLHIVGSLRRTLVEPGVDTHHHGALEFYALDEARAYHAYAALFDHGRLIAIVAHPPVIP